MQRISIFGPGFILGRFCDLYPDEVDIMHRNDRMPLSNIVLYGISTVHNYNNLSHDTSVNLQILSEVLQWLTPEHTFNFLSSWFVYGNVRLPARETYTCKPKGNYSITKKIAEDFIILYCKAHDIPYRIFRLANVFGAGDECSARKNALQYLTNKLRNGEQIELYNDGAFYRDYAHVDEVCRMLKLAISKSAENEIYNLGSGRKSLFRLWIDAAKSVLMSDSEIVSVDAPDFHKKVQAKSFYFDVSKLAYFGIHYRGNPLTHFLEMLNE